METFDENEQRTAGLTVDTQRHVDINADSINLAGNVIVAENKKVFGTTQSGAQHEIIGLNEYDIDDETYDQVEVGSESVHLNLNTNDDPNFSEHVTVDTPSGKKVIPYSEELAPVATSGSYSDLSDKPGIPEPGVLDVSQMMNIPTNADVSAFMFRRTGEDDKKLIKLHGYDNSGGTDDLVITPELGFGPHYDAFLAQLSTNDGVNFGTYGIRLTKEFGDTPGTITIPNGCNAFDVSYYAKGKPKASYYVTTDGTVHPFELENTPVENFCNSGGPSSTITINGQQVVKSTIREISFGESYAGVTSIGNSFLRDCSSLASVDLSMFTEIASIGNYFMIGCTSLTSVDLSMYANVMSAGPNFLQGLSSLSAIHIGDVDWSGKTVSTSYLMANVPNVSTSALYAASQDLADKFKAKMNGKISEWTVVVG
jgi:hypothetical protein